MPSDKIKVTVVAFPGYANSFVIRTKTDPLSLLPAVERTIWRLDPDQAISGAKTMEHIIQSATLEPGSRGTRLALILAQRRR
jgi:hypothetical protein